MRILVTGTTGYLGSHVVRALRARGATVVALCRDETSRLAAETDGLEARVAALGDTTALASIARDVDGVAHLAASEQPAFLTISRAAAGVLIGALRPGAPFVMQGGSMVFGPTGRHVHPGTPPFAPPPGLAARAEFDKFVLDRADAGVRTHVVYGAMVMGGAGAMIPNCLIRAARLAGYSGHIDAGEAVWSAVHVEDWADLIVRVMLDGKTAGAAVVAAAQDVTMSQLARAVARTAIPPLETRPVDAADAQALWGFFAAGFAVDQHFNGDRPRRDYGWAPRLRDIDAEMAATAAQISLGAGDRR